MSIEGEPEPDTIYSSGRTVARLIAEHKLTNDELITAIVLATNGEVTAERYDVAFGEAILTVVQARRGEVFPEPASQAQLDEFWGIADRQREDGEAAGAASAKAIASHMLGHDITYRPDEVV